jgi:hypothetical protein
MFYELLCNGEIYNGKGMKYDEKEGIINLRTKTTTKLYLILIITKLIKLLKI